MNDLVGKKRNWKSKLMDKMYKVFCPLIGQDSESCKQKGCCAKNEVM